MNNDRFTHALAPFLILSAILAILFVGFHVATVDVDELRMAHHVEPKAGQIFVKAPAPAQTTRLTALAAAKQG